MPKIYDNIENMLTEGLNDTLGLSERADFCVGYFNLRGWKQVADKIDNLAGTEIVENEDEVHRTCRLLVGMQKMPIDIIREHFASLDGDTLDQADAFKLKKKLAQEFKEQLTIGTPSNEDEAGLKKLSRQLKEKKVVVKLHLRYPLHAKLYLAFSNDKRVPIVGFLGSSNLTLAGLVKQGELNIDVMDQDAAAKLAEWFEARWEDRWCIDISDELIEIIDNSWASDELFSPYYIYIKIAYHLSREARAGISEFKLPRVFQRELLEFQQKAVLIAAHHLHKRGGVIIGDVVGLGKTITATALAKIFEDDFFLETLIICPKNLVTMWEGYAHKYQLRAKIISQSNVQALLPSLRRYRLVIIDESHNLRNDQGSRYRAIKSYLEENDSKVILLTATPYNKTYLDLANQLKLFISDDKDLGISPEHYIKNLGGHVIFAANHTGTFIRSIKAFEKSMYADDWRELMRLYLVRRTRSFIKTNYADTDAATGRKYLTFADGTKNYFPERLPKAVQYKFNSKNTKDQYAKLYSKKVVDLINDLELPRYGLQQYINASIKVTPQSPEDIIISNLSRAGKRMMGFCRTNLFKRLESSGYSFLLSLSRHILRNYIFIYAILNRLPLPIGKNISQNLDDFLEDNDTDDELNEKNPLNLILEEQEYIERAKGVYNLFNSPANKKQFDWIGSEYFLPHLQDDLLSDSDTILQVLRSGKDWQPAEDKQLLALYKLITETHPQEKILIFTQFSDTAFYLTRELIKLGVTDIESVTGDDENPTEKAYRFSPHSNSTNVHTLPANEIRVLISTDVLSEGQNLQDSHIVVNFDLPWAIIRLIQRAGRVDRIGQKSDRILCYSFLPEDGLEEIIELRRTLTTRIHDNANVVGSDETFFEGDPTNLEDLYSEKSGILDDDDDTEIDLASYAYQIWKNATDNRPELKKIIPDLPNVIYSTKKSVDAEDIEGVVVYTRTADDNDILARLDTSGKVITQSQYEILKAVECTPDSPALIRLTSHHDLVKKAVDHIREDEKNSAGALGRKTGVKYRLYMKLERYCRENDGTLFVTEELKKAVDDIYKYPLKEYARESINRQLKSGIADEDLASLVVSLREEDKLVIIDDAGPAIREPQIICSLGIKHELLLP